MNAASWLQHKWTNRVRQFGLRTALSQVARTAIRPMWEVKRDLVLAIPDHRPERVDYPEIRRITREDVGAAADRGELTERQRTLLLGFLDRGCYGFKAEMEGRLAGYAFVQPSGNSRATKLMQRNVVECEVHREARDTLWRDAETNF